MSTQMPDHIAAGPSLYADVTSAGINAPPPAQYGRCMLESFVTALIIYFFVIDPVGNAQIFLAMTEAATGCIPRS